MKKMPLLIYFATIKTVFAPGSGKKGEFRTFEKFVFPLKKVKKVDLRGQKGSIEWKDAKDVLVKQKQLGEVP